MLLLLLTVSCVFLGPSAGEVEDKSLCYGEDLRLPREFVPVLFNGELYLTPSDGGFRKLLMDKGESKDPRLVISHSSVYFKDVTERDEGVFAISFNGIRPLIKIINLKVLDCADLIEKSYWHLWELMIPRQAEFLEFRARLSPDQPKVLWNRTNSQIHNENGRMTVNGRTLEFRQLVQADSGYYSFRKKDNTILSRHLLTVQVDTGHYDAQVKQSVHISYPWVVRTWTVTFIPAQGGNPQTVMKAGRLVLNNDWFLGRIRTSDSGIEIDPVEDNDSGIFEFRDQEGNLALNAKLEVIREITAMTYVVGIALVVLLLGCCCCCYCCCKKKCCKKDKSSSQASAARAVYYHDTSQPTGPSYSAAPSTLVLTSYAREPTASLPAPVYPPVNVHVNPSQPEVPAPGGQGFTPAPSSGTDFLLSDYEPRFELKGTAFPSAPPLSSNTASSDVYTSDKLNFL